MQQQRIFFLLRTLLILIFLYSCSSSSPVNKELAYLGEPLNEIAPMGLIIGHAKVPLDAFPHDNRATIIYLQNTKTKEVYEYGKTQGVFYMKLPVGDYIVKDIWAGGLCNTATGIMISNFFLELPEGLMRFRQVFEREPAAPLSFSIRAGKKTDIGNLMLTCMDWDARKKFKDDFSDFIDDGKFQIFKVMSSESQECGCKIVRKLDGVSDFQFRKVLNPR